MSNCNDIEKIPVQVVISWDNDINNIYYSRVTKQAQKAQKKISNPYDSMLDKLNSLRPEYFKQDIPNQNTGIIHPINCKTDMSPMSLEKKIVLNIWKKITTSSVDTIKSDSLQFTKMNTYSFTFTNDVQIVETKNIIDNGLVLIRYDCIDRGKDKNSTQNICKNLDIDVIPLKKCEIIKNQCVLGKKRDKNILKKTKMAKGLLKNAIIQLSLEIV